MLYQNQNWNDTNFLNFVGIHVFVCFTIFWHTGKQCILGDFYPNVKLLCPKPFFSSRSLSTLRTLMLFTLCCLPWSISSCMGNVSTTLLTSTQNSLNSAWQENFYPSEYLKKLICILFLATLQWWYQNDNLSKWPVCLTHLGKLVLNCYVLVNKCSLLRDGTK